MCGSQSESFLGGATRLSECSNRSFEHPLFACLQTLVHDQRNPTQLNKRMVSLDRRHLLAAGLFSYSFANYADHLGIGHERFERLMPEVAETMEAALRDGWPDDRLAQALEMELADVPEWRRRFERALAIVDAPDAAAAYRNGVRFSIEDAVEDGLEGPDAIERLVEQLCYRAADLAFLLELEGTVLSQYSEALRDGRVRNDAGQ